MATKWRDLLQKEFGYSLSFSVNTLLAWIIYYQYDGNFISLYHPHSLLKYKQNNKVLFMRRWRTWGKKEQRSLSLCLCSHLSLPSVWLTAGTDEWELFLSTHQSATSSKPSTWWPRVGGQSHALSEWLLMKTLMERCSSSPPSSVFLPVFQPEVLPPISQQTIHLPVRSHH